MPNRPNILFLMADEHRPDVLGYAGDDVVRTPNLDRLAESGVVFENAYTPAPRCMPARQCMMSGQLPRTVGCERFGDDLEPRSMTFARRLAQYGYETVAAGKLHHVGDDKAQGWTRLLGMNGGCNVDVVDDEERGTYDRRTKWTDAKEIRRAGVGKPGVGWKSNRDEYAVRGAKNFVEERFLSPYYDRENVDRPLALKVSLRQPHYPYLTTEERFEYYLNRVDPYDDEDDVSFRDHPFLSERHLDVGRDNFWDGREGDVSLREIRRATAAYYGMVETVDEYFGEVLDALERAGQDIDEWVVVYTSDHGEMLGQHGVWEKGHFFEASAGVPLLVRWPERFDPGTVTENVNLCDLFATLCDLADVPLPEDHALDSRSLVPLLAGDSDGWREAHADESVSAYDDDLMLKRGDLKYMALSEGKDVLFDLAADPGETANRIDDPEYEAEVERFRRRRDELGYGPDADSNYENAGYDPGVLAA